MSEIGELKELILALSARLDKSESQHEELRKVVIGLSKNMADSFKIIDQNFEALVKRMDIVEHKIDKLAEHAAEQFGSVDGKINEIGGILSDKLDELKVEVIKIQKVSGYSEQYENLLSISR